MDKSKFQSRKFICWLTSTILLVLSLIINCIIKTDVMAEVCKTLAEGYTWISALYIGVNGAQKFANKNEVNNEVIER